MSKRHRTMIAINLGAAGLDFYLGWVLDSILFHQFGFLLLCVAGLWMIDGVPTRDPTIKGTRSKGEKK